MIGNQKNLLLTDQPVTSPRSIIMKKLAIFSLAILLGLGSCKKEKGTDRAKLDVFTISGTASSPWYGTGITEGNRTAKAFVDLNNRKVYTFDEALAHQSDLNFVFCSSYYAGNLPESARELTVSSLNSGRGWNTNTADRSLVEFGVRTECTFYSLTPENLSDFSTLETTQQLDVVFATLKPQSARQFFNCNEVNTSSNRVFNIAFKTHQGKRGVFRMTSYIPNKPFGYSIEVKMEK